MRSKYKYRCFVNEPCLVFEALMINLHPLRKVSKFNGNVNLMSFYKDYFAYYIRQACDVFFSSSCHFFLCYFHYASKILPHM